MNFSYGGIPRDGAKSYRKQLIGSGRLSESALLWGAGCIDRKTSFPGRGEMMTWFWNVLENSLTVPSYQDMIHFDRSRNAREGIL
jgi:hypothetical protein